MKQPTPHTRLCAYCGSPGPLTREEIFPKFLSKKIGYNTFVDQTRGGLVRGAPTVRDVCRQCNNEMLSSLDGYFAELYRAYFRKNVPTPVFVEFSCDYRRLLRWLLKAFFNLARGRRNDVLISALAKHVPFIRGREAAPPFPTSVFVGVISESVASARERQFGMPESFHPFVHRFGDLRVHDERLKDAVILGQVFSVNSYVFTVAIFSPGISDERHNTMIKGMLRDNRLFLLSPTTGKVTITEPVSDARTYMLSRRKPDLFLRK